MRGRTAGEGEAWLAALLAGQPVLQRFLRFRADAITGLVEEAGAVARSLGRSVALDLFPPGLAPLVGQDYPALARLATWAKPMTYRLAKGPAGLRLEVPALVRGLARHLGLTPEEAWGWAGRHVPGLGDTDLERIDREGMPLEIVACEARAAVELLRPAPCYVGVETVSYPGVIDVTPAQVREGLEAARAAGAAGAILSWDLLHTPLANLRAVAGP